jgi:hypothetical protein
MDHRVACGPRNPETHGEDAEQDEKGQKPGSAQHATQRGVPVCSGSGEIGYHGQFWQVTGVAGYTPVVVDVSQFEACRGCLWEMR